MGFAVMVLATCLAGAQTTAIVSIPHTALASAQPGDEFSFAVAVDDAGFIGSSPGENHATGAVYEYDCTAAACTQTNRVAPTDLATGHRFGAAIAVSGDTLAVGAPGQSPPAVYVFIRSGSTWVQQAKLVATGSASGAGFGRMLALAGDHLAVGAPGADARAGAVYVFDRAASAWTQTVRFAAADTIAGDDFGRSMAISGDTLVVGAPLKSSGTGHFANGAAYIFVRTASAWPQQAKLMAQVSSDGDGFGTALAIDGDRLLVGAPMAAGRKGGAYVFERTGSAWTQHDQLASPVGADGDQFGWSVALSGNAALVGAPFASNSCGASYSYIRSGSGWTLTDESVIGAITLGDLVGWSVAGDPTHWVVASPGSAGPLDHSGQAHVMQVGDRVFADGFDVLAANTCSAPVSGQRD